ncbi:MAG: aromatic ring-hydroxylating dioxygenase subunit alpha [Rhodobacteraceae bacterium]|nr:aromatic ring-hydroxylating dioxygenase subunit alpha [Paracoccaceae bacterium]
MSGDYQSIRAERRNQPMGPNHGYYLAGRPPEDPELTHVGPGTPCGEYWRRFWFPVELTEQVTELPRRLRILGEDLVIFRTREGEYGLLHLHCSHRNASLEFGIVEADGLRCCYHGWKYAPDGTVLETPGEPENSPIRHRICHGAYPVIEYKGLLFAYMGPPDTRPPFPVYDTFNWPGHDLVPYRISYPCNWLQVAENTMDPIHTVYLHTRVSNVQFEPTWGVTPLIRFHNAERSLYSTLTYRWGDNIWVRTQETVFPSFSGVGAFWEDAAREKVFFRSSITKWTVPLDDTNCMIIAWRHFGPGIDPDGRGKRDEVGLESVDFEGQTEQRTYLQRQLTPGDYEAQISQGLISSHAAENLGVTDQGIVMLRRRLREGIREVGEGILPPRPAPEDTDIPLYIQDTVYTIPLLDGEDDDALKTAVTDAVMEVVIGGDALRGEARRTFIEDGLRALKSDPRFAPDRAPYPAVAEK